MTVHTINIDMDGVVADFNAAARMYLTATDDEHTDAAATGRWPDHQWRKLARIPNYFRDLPKMPRADELMDLARRFRDELGWHLTMLTAIPAKNDMPDCFHDKIEWMREHYPDVRVRFGPYADDKATHAKSGDILVDDKTSNCTQWRDAGGIAVQVTKDYDQALERLRELFVLLSYQPIDD